MLIQEYLNDNILAPDLKHMQSYKEAFHALTDSECKPFDVILLDLTLPDHSGEPLIHEIMSIGISDYILKDDQNSFSLYKRSIYNIERYRTLANLEESEKQYYRLQGQQG